MDVESLDFLEVVGSGGPIPRGVKGASGSGNIQGGGEARSGDGMGGDDGQEMKSGGIRYLI